MAHMQHLYPEIEADYVLCETIGSGGFAKVKAGVHKLTGEKVAIKIMDKEQLGRDLPRVYREIEALRRLHHQHICQLFQIIETEDMIHLVLEFCPGGELFDYIVAKEKLSEKEARSFFRQIVSALYYCHSCGIIHRDLKPENLLLDEDSNIKLIDFGLVAEPDNTKDLLETCCGSPAYAAPELIKGGPYIGPKADVWSLGVLLYALLNGFLPFDDDNTARLYSLIQKGEYEITEWLSRGSLKILSQLLQVDPYRRASVECLLQHPWVVKSFNKPVDWQTRVDMDNLDTECVTLMAAYNQTSFQEMSSEILEWNYDNTTATYLLLMQQKMTGRKPVIVGHSTDRKEESSSSMNSPLLARSPLVRSPPTYMVNSLGKLSSEEPYSPPDVSANPNPNSVPPQPKPRTRKISLGIQIHPPSGEIVTVQKPKHPAISLIKEESIQNHPPLPTPVVNRECLTPPPTMKKPAFPVFLAENEGRIPLSRTTDNFLAMSGEQPYTHRLVKKTSITLNRTSSYESNLHHAVDAKGPLGVETPRTRRRRLGSLELIFKKARRVLSQNKAAPSTGPRKIKGIYNFDTTSRKNADEVMLEIERVLRELGVKFEKDSFTFHCSVFSYKESSSHKNDKAKPILFDLEVCILPRLEMLGIRRKRIKGDTWEYKRICGQIFKTTRL